MKFNLSLRLIIIYLLLWSKSKSVPPEQNSVTMLMLWLFYVNPINETMFLWGLNLSNVEISLLNSLSESFIEFNFLTATYSCYHIP